LECLGLLLADRLAIVGLVEKDIHVMALGVVFDMQRLAYFGRAHPTLLQIETEIRELDLGAERLPIRGMHFDDELGLRIQAGNVRARRHEVTSHDDGCVGFFPPSAKHGSTV
jgi:hypothetical protein